MKLSLDPVRYWKARLRRTNHSRQIIWSEDLEVLVIMQSQLETDTEWISSTLGRHRAIAEYHIALQVNSKRTRKIS